MKFSILALDYDGTLTNTGALDTDIRSALAEGRARGLHFILVTGRILRDLQSIETDLTPFDVVVAENGAVLFFPASGRSVNLGQRPPEQFVQELRHRAIEITVGDCVLEAWADAAPTILSVIRQQELPYVLVFNRSRVMVLPQGLSKATGLHEALRTLRLSEHNTIAIGDAENDYPLLQASEIGAAVAWGSPALQAVADAIVPGTSPSAIADYIRALSQQFRIPQAMFGRRKLLLGHTATGTSVELAVQGRNVLVVGDPRSGKSWVTGMLCEQLILLRYSVCVIDPEGDYSVLSGLPGVLTLGGGTDPPPLHELELALRHAELSVVLDLSRLAQDRKAAYVRDVLLTLKVLRRQTGLPHRIVLDEAHYFLRGEETLALLDPKLEGYTLVTCRPSQLAPAVWQGKPPVIVTRLTQPGDINLLLQVCDGCENQADWATLLSVLPAGQAALLPNAAEASGCLQICTAAPRLTTHVRHRHKYIDVPVSEEHAFVFTRHGTPTGNVARTLKQFVECIQVVPPEVLLSHLERRDFSRWIGDVFGDNRLAGQVYDLERQHRRWRMPDIQRALTALITDRYSIDEATTG